MAGPDRQAGRHRRRRHRGLGRRRGARSSSSGRCSTSRWSNPTRSAPSASANRPSRPRAPSTICSGIDEREFMRATQASFKLGIAFENWARDRRPLHPLLRPDRQIDLDGRLPAFLAAGARAGLRRRARRLLLRAAGGRGRQVRHVGDESRINYAYHLDASALCAASCAGFAEPLGVERVEGKIAEVEQHAETGFIEALVLEIGRAGRRRPVHRLHRLSRAADRADARRPATRTGAHWLPTDSALAVQTASVGPAVPYTRAIAHEAGWQWRIPLQHRVGNGLVYCSDYHVRRRGARRCCSTRIEGEMLIEPRLIRFRAGAPAQGVGQELRRPRACPAASSSRSNRPAST